MDAALSVEGGSYVERKEWDERCSKDCGWTIKRRASESTEDPKERKEKKVQLKELSSAEGGEEEREERRRSAASRGGL